MPDTTRVWIYQANRKITPEEKEQIETDAAGFGREWTSHDQAMDAAIELLHDRFLIIAANEDQAKASGCGIDKSVNFVKSISEKTGIDFFTRTLVLYMDKDEVMEEPLHSFWARRKAGLIHDHTLLFDNTVRTAGELKRKWLVPFSESWHQEMWVR